MNKVFVKISQLGLIFILLVMLAGSIVRTTGSGMGCPDWPKCFDCIIPPTSEDQLPENYKEIYSDYRQKKIEKFAGFLSAIGFNKEAEALKNDPNLLVEQDFNAAKTWTEYGNRLVGFIAGNLLLVQFFWVLLKYRRNRKLLILTFLNLIIIAVEAWFGSIVVATNLVPWTITLHMFLALVIVGIQIRIIQIIQDKTYQVKLSPLFKYLFYVSILLTFVQIILGAQVRQEVDFMVKESLNRADWISSMPGDFYFHRSFSWIVLAINLLLWYLNRKAKTGITALSVILVLIGLEFLTGILFSYAGMPAIIQPLHLLLATLILCIQFFTLKYFKQTRNSLLS